MRGRKGESIQGEEAIMNMRTLRDALNIMLCYADGDVSADHDVIFAGPDGVTPDDMTPADVKRLYDLHWTWDTKLECWRHYC